MLELSESARQAVAEANEPLHQRLSQLENRLMEAMAEDTGEVLQACAPTAPLDWGGVVENGNESK